MPVGVVVTLLRTLIATPLAVVVLASELGSPAVEPTVGGEESHISRPGLAVAVIVIVLMHAELEIIVAVVV